MRGNVSTYCLNAEDVANVVDPIMRPPSPTILATTIDITIIRPQNHPECTMPGFLHVKWSRIKDALRWLKNNNPLWENITISDDQLDLYSDEDCIPETIKVTMTYSDQIAVVDRERAEYVTDDEDEEELAEDCQERNITVGMSGKVWNAKKYLSLTSVKGVKDMDNEVDVMIFPQLTTWTLLFLHSCIFSFHFNDSSFDSSLSHYAYLAYSLIRHCCIMLTWHSSLLIHLCHHYIIFVINLSSICHICHTYESLTHSPPFPINTHSSPVLTLTWSYSNILGFTPQFNPDHLSFLKRPNIKSRS